MYKTRSGNDEKVWTLPPVQRGVYIENDAAATIYRLDYHIGTEYNGYYPVIDFITTDNRAISMKSLNPRLTSYHDIDYLKTVITRYASSLNSFRIFQGGVQIEQKELVIVFPPGSVTDEIKYVVNDIQESSRNIKIVIKELY